MGVESGDVVLEKQLSSYSGSTSLSFLCDLTSLSIDQINFISCQLFALLLSYILRKWIKNPITRLWYSLVCGISICFFCFGTQILHIIISAGMSYLIISVTKSRHMPWIVLVVSMGYLSFLHIKRQFYYQDGYALDITGPLMVLTQKLTSLAFSIKDGIEEKKDNELSPLQKQRMVREVPSFMEFSSYVFQFQSMLAGPLVFYDDFYAFIQVQEDIPSPGAEVRVKLIKSIFFAVFFLGLGKHLDVQHIRREEFLDGTSSIYKISYIVVSTTIERCKYYHAWILADAVCNMSGLGYDRMKGTWDLVSNVHPFRLESALSMKEILDNWNIGTMKWLRHVVYERSPKNLRTYLVYMVSAFWHGFYPGYYTTFLSGALFTTAARTVRKHIRPYFLNNKGAKRGYDFATWFISHLVLAYITFAFVIQDFYPAIAVYMQVYFFLHVLAALAMLILPLIFGKSSGADRSKQGSATVLTPIQATDVGTLSKPHSEQLDSQNSQTEPTTLKAIVENGGMRKEIHRTENVNEAKLNDMIPEDSPVGKENSMYGEDWKTRLMNSHETSANSSAKLKTG